MDAPALRAALVHAELAGDFLDETSLQADREAVHFAGDLVITVHQADGLGFHAYFQDLGCALEFQVLDHRDDIAIREHVAERVLHDPLGGGFIGGWRFGLPLMAAGQAFVVVRMGQDFGHFTHRTGWSAHVRRE